MEARIQEGERLFQEGRKQEAEAIFRAILKEEPGHSRAANNLAVISMADGRLSEALSILTGVLAASPQDQATLENLLHLYCIGKNWPQAHKVAEKLLAMAPDDLKTLELSALVRFKNGDTGGARKDLTAALALAPNRADLAVRLALLNNQPARIEMELWPDPISRHPIEIAKFYQKSWGGLKTDVPLIRAAQTLAHLFDATDLPLEPARSPASAHVPPPDPTPADVAGLSIMFAPTTIAGQSAMMARWLRDRGVATTNVEIYKSYLGYQADYYYPKSTAERPDFMNQMMAKAAEQDILCLDFASSLNYFPSFVTRSDYRLEKTPGQPYADLLPLKDKGVKIFFQFWGSDHLSQSIFPYYFLRYLGFEGLPRPPFQTLHQHRHVTAAAEVADALFNVNFGLDYLPRRAPHFDVAIEPARWPLKTSYRPRLEKILTAPTDRLKKNYSMIEGALNSFLNRHPEAMPFCVRNTPNDQVPQLYADADIGIDQATYGYGLLSLELMALGLPVICACDPATPGWRAQAPVLNFSNIRELAARLEECAGQPEIFPELGRRGREYVLEYHDIDVIGAAYSRYMAEAVSGGPVSQAPMPGYEENIKIWNQNPETVRAFRFYDVAVPLFCALGEFNYASQLCLDAMDCDWRDEKFMAWYRAIHQVKNVKMLNHKDLPETESLARETKLRCSQLTKSRALLEEYLGQLAEANQLP